MTFTTIYYVYIRDVLSTVYGCMAQYEYCQLVYVGGVRDRLVYVLSGDIGWAKWELSIGLSSIVMYINGRQMCGLTVARQRKCGVSCTVIPSAVLCVVIVVSTVILATEICTAW